MVSVKYLLLCIPILWGWSTTMAPCAELQRNYYTPERLAVMASNIEKYPWARSQRDAMVAAGEKWAAYDDEKLLSMIIPPQVPRAYDVHSFGCPVHGVAANAGGLYKWAISLDKPWKITCPAGGEEYPSNDFGAYLASGMKDRSLLTGEYADDGWGWNKPGDETNYWFVAYYAHWLMSRFTMPAIEALGNAAIVCEDAEQAQVYAHKCALMLWKLAEYYPDYEYKSQSREAKEHNPDYNGKWTNMIWEVWTPNATAYAYDAVRPLLAGDAELLARTGMGAEQLDEYIRDRLLREAATCTIDGSHRIAANYGTHQQSLLRLAAVLRDSEKSPTSDEMLEYIIANPNPVTMADVGIQDALVSLVYRDGIPLESIGYNYGWVYSLAAIASSLIELDINFFEDTRFQKLLTWPFDVMLCGKFVPPLGDTGDMFAAGSALSPTAALPAAPHFPDPRVVKVARTNPAAGNALFSPPAGDALDALPATDDVQWGVNSHIFPAYGLASLQSGAIGTQTSSALFYGNYPGHVHYDQLNMLLFSQGNAMLTDIGYPEQTDSRNHKRYAFFENTVAHNTVVVDSHKQTRGPGTLHAYQPTGFAQVVDASCEGAYSGTVSLYRRANVLVELSPTQSYLFDAFYVDGGKQHDYSALGAPAETSCTPPLGPVQEKGTLAGEDVPQEHFYDDERFAAKPLGTMSYGGYRGSGFQFLFNVRRANLDGPAVFEWKLKQPGEGETQYNWQGIGLRAHLLLDNEEVIAADAKPQTYTRMPDTIQYMLRRRVAPEGQELRTRFVTVYEPYTNETFINRVVPIAPKPDDGNAVAARIELADGGVDYVFHSIAPEQTYTLEDGIIVAGEAACFGYDAQGAIYKGMLLNGTRLTAGELTLESPGQRKSTIVSVDYSTGTIEIADPLLAEPFVAGQQAIIAPDTFADSVTMREVIDATHLSIGDEDLRVASGPINELLPEQSRITTKVSIPHIQDGMTVLNGLLQPQGRITSGDRITIDRTGYGPLSAEAFPPGADGSHPRFTVVMAAPGDTILIPSFVEFVRK